MERPDVTPVHPSGAKRQGAMSSRYGMERQIATLSTITVTRGYIVRTGPICHASRFLHTRHELSVFVEVIS